MSYQKCALLFSLIVIQAAVQLVLATEKCNYCRGINCQRSSYQVTENCPDTLDACVSVFQNGVIEAQGCLESLKEYCDDNRMACDVCVSDNCNNKSLGTCVQCVDSEDKRCSSNPESLTGKSCEIARSGRNFCYTTITNDKQIKRGCAISLSEQTNCLSDENCYLCDPSERSDCNNHLIDAYADSTTDSPATGETASSSTASPSSSTEPTSPSTAGSTESPSTGESSSTAAPTEAPEPTPTTEDPEGGGAASITVSISFLLILANLALYF